jgi:hypothetical protein
MARLGMALGVVAFVGVRGARAQDSHVGVTFTLPMNKHVSIKFYASTGLSTRTGSNFPTGGIAWQYRWGGGL